MEKIKSKTLIRGIMSGVILLLLIPLPVWCYEGTEDGSEKDKTLSPYFHVISEDEGTDGMPLKESSAVVDIAGVVAHVKVKQVYKNEGTKPIEAIYIFPGSTRAAVHGMTMTIGERVIKAKIEERGAAKKTYEKAKEEGKSASLLEQHRPNVFQMSVANIMPGDEIKVELLYSENIIPTDGLYEFVYPTVVGPRYSSKKAGTAPASEQWVANPYLQEEEKPSYSFDLKVNIATGIPIKDIVSTSHKVNINFSGANRAEVSLSDTERFGGNRDYILQYRLQGGQIESGLLLYKGENENFFLLNMEPPERITSAQILPREYIYIVDVSGSMHGFPLDITKKLIKDLAKKLRPTDKFNILLFAGGSEVLSNRSLPATPVNIKRAFRLLDSKSGGGSTRLLPALKRALKLPADKNYARTIVVATDGYVNVEAEAFDLIRKNLNKANLFAFGIGSGVNRHLIEGMARAGLGEPFVVTKHSEAPIMAEKLGEYILTPLLSHIKLDFEGFEAYDIEPESVPDLLAKRPLTIFGKWKGKAKGKIIIRGNQGDKAYEKIVNVGDVNPQSSNSALKYLWARHRISTLGDYEMIRGNSERKKEITRLGLTYNLLTKYTSFIAVDEIIRNVSGKPEKVKQPLPLPQGVTNLAVGGNVPAVPEPETYMLVVVLGIVLIWRVFTYRKRIRL
ncbi:MAG: VIT domain-containing protein [Deltaproteobacteria bacterium]|nr:VIT domain-containing protein [Deltaproteobacteria bacterium]